MTIYITHFSPPPRVVSGAFTQVHSVWHMDKQMSNANSNIE